jgi:hypothetical protein
MGSKERQILGAIKSQIEAVNGTGTYTFDLSGSDQVLLGATMIPDRLPSAYIYALSLSSQITPGRTVLRNYDRTFQVQIEAWVNATSDAVGEQMLRALDMQDDILKAIESDRSLGGEVDDVILNAQTYDGEALQRPGLGCAVIVCTCTYREVGGTGS